MAEKLVAEPLPRRGAAHQAGDIDEFELGRDDFRRAGEPGADAEALVRHRDATDIRLDCAEGVIGRFRRRRRGQRVEQRRFADIRQADDTAIEAHDFPYKARPPASIRGGRSASI